MPAAKNPDGTITVTGTFDREGPAPLQPQQDEAIATCGRAVALVECHPSASPLPGKYVHTSLWKPL